jgi:predicted metalloprotease with PDZ domain
MPYVRGELLALRWDKALLVRGETLQHVLCSLLLPDEAAEDGSRNRPDRVAALRLVSALRARLGPPLDRDIAEFVDEGRTIPFTDDFLGPCFAGKTLSAPAFELGFDVSTLQSHITTGVVPGSAAERAGVRDGMRLAEFSIRYDTVDGKVALRVVDAEELRTIRYVPLGSNEIELHEYARLPGASQDPACRRWIEGH